MLRRLPYATRLDLIDRALNVMARSSLLESAWRRSLDVRKTTSFKAYQLYSRTLNVIGRDRSDIINQTLEYADYGAKDLLLTTDSHMRVPQLIETTALLAELPGYRGKTAIIVPDQKTETSYKQLAGQAQIINLQRFWLDTAIDINNHTVARQVLNTVRDTARTDTERAMVEAIAMNLHTQLIQALRTIAAVRAARADGATVIAIAVDGDVRYYSLCFEAFQRGNATEVVALSQYGAGNRALFDAVDLRFDPVAAMTRARSHLARYQITSARQPEPVPPPNATSDKSGIVIVSDALPNSIYWHAVRNLTATAQAEGQPLKALVSRASAATQLRATCQTVDIAQPSLGAIDGTAFRANYLELLDLVDRAAHARNGRDERVQLCLDYSLARLSIDQTIDSLGYRAFRTTRDVLAWLNHQNPVAVIVLPHWSTIAWATLSGAPIHKLTTASAPVVTVTGNNASLVEWGSLSMIGCYGTQCVTAFEDVDTPRDKLELTGSLTLDHALKFGREETRARHPVFARLSSQSRRLILYATSGVNKNEAQILSAFVAFCQAPENNASLIVRPHPTLGRAFYETALSGTSSAIQAIVTDGTVHEAIAAADMVVTDFSTVGAEAVLLGRPLLVVNMTGQRFPSNNYADLGVAVEAHTPGDIAPLSARLLNEGAFWPDASERRAQFSDAYNWGSDGQAARRFLAKLHDRIHRQAREHLHDNIRHREPRPVATSAGFEAAKI